ncbi:hypothetical protein SDC9_164770 [bioreactor metagenome]|uniref:Uncharacterized protein n=1 Tax=bioreactor metagenome TaxID=1076179 RepID=A0A645FSJ7_9ZZZZ
MFHPAQFFVEQMHAAHIIDWVVLYTHVIPPLSRREHKETHYSNNYSISCRLEPYTLSVNSNITAYIHTRGIFPLTFTRQNLIK